MRIYNTKTGKWKVVRKSRIKNIINDIKFDLFLATFKYRKIKINKEK